MLLLYIRLHAFHPGIFWQNSNSACSFINCQPFSALPYGSSTLHYVVILTSISFPSGCAFAMIFTRRLSNTSITLLTILGHAIALYILWCALMSPNPPLMSFSLFNNLGSIVMICSWTFFTTLLSYIKTIVTVKISEYNGNTGLFWVGFNTQLGACLGAGFMYVLVNYTSLFNESGCDWSCLFNSLSYVCRMHFVLNYAL